MCFLESSKKGELIKDLEIYDSHAHLNKFASVTVRKDNAKHLVEISEQMNFKKIAISSSLAICNDFKRGNDEMVDALQEYPEKFLGYITVNPTYEDGMVKEVLRLSSKSKNIIGIKIHPSYNKTAVTSSKYEEIFEYANEKELIALVHTFSAGDVLNLEKIVKKYPKIKMIFGHCGAVDGTVEAARIIKENENSYGDIPVSYCYNNTLEYLVNNSDENKLFFGTDMPLFDYRATYGRVMYANISDSAKRKIMGLNFKKMISGKSNV